VLGGVLFGLNGAFILTAHAVIGPIFCLPILLLGIELSHQAAVTHRRMGWSLVALGLAVSIYAGFPEVAFFNGLLAAFWTLLRLAQGPAGTRWTFALKLAAGGMIGLALTAPLTSAFLQYLALADIGSHSHILAHDALTASAAPLQLLPMVYGAIGALPPAALQLVFHDMWVRIGGWFGCVPVLLALYALIPKPRLQPERWAFAAWVLLWEARYFGFPGITALFNLVPGIAFADSVRFSTDTVEFAVFALAACGFDDLCNFPASKRTHLAMALAAFTACLLISIIPAVPFLPEWFHLEPGLLPLATLYLVGVAASLILVTDALINQRNAAWVQAVTITGAIGMFLVLQVTGSRPGHLDLRGVHAMQAQQGLARFYTIGPFEPNYGAAYGLASLNYAQLPAPALWTTYFKSHLFAGADLITMVGEEPGQAASVETNLQGFEAVGTKYIVTSPGQNPFAQHFAVPAGVTYQNFVPLQAGDTVSGSIPAMIWPFTAIDSVAVTLGTYHETATGPLIVTLCSQARCATGQAVLDRIADASSFTIPLAQTLQISHGPLTFSFNHPAGRPVALWLTSFPGAPALHAPYPVPQNMLPAFTFSKNGAGAQPFLVFQGQVMDVYQLPNPAPYAQAQGPCALQIRDRQHMASDCAAPTTLIRRELFYPGWHATVNGAPALIAASGALFETVKLPAGHADISFWYRPPGTRLACAAALLAGLAWGATACLAWWRGRIQTV